MNTLDNGYSGPDNTLIPEKTEYESARPARKGNGLIVLRMNGSLPDEWKDAPVCRDIIDAWTAKHVSGDICRLNGSLLMSLPESGSLVEYRWPRHVAWNDIPVAADAWFRLSNLDMPYPLDGNGHCPSRPTMQQVSREGITPVIQSTADINLKNCRAVIFDMGNMPSRYMLSGLIEALRLYRFPLTPLPVCGWFNGRSVQIIDNIALRQTADEMRAHHRFMWSHKFNACVIMRRAAAEASGSVAVGKRYDETAFRLHDEYGGELGNPWNLQLLYAIAGLSFPLSQEEALAIRRERAAERSKSGLERRSPVDEWMHMCRRLPFFDMKEDVNDPSGREIWKGSGRYTSYESEHRGNLIDHAGTKPLVSGFINLVLADMIMRDREGNARLTPSGARFLDIIGDSAADPDVLLRWRTPDGLIGSPADIQAMDRWLYRNFRAVKRRVQHLPDGGALRRRLRSWELDGSHPDNIPTDPLPEPEAIAPRHAAAVILGRVMICSMQEINDRTPVGMAIMDIMNLRRANDGTAPTSGIMGQGEQFLLDCWGARNGEDGIPRFLIFGGLPLAVSDIKTPFEGMKSASMMTRNAEGKVVKTPLPSKYEEPARAGSNALPAILAEHPDMSEFGTWMVCQS